MKQALLSVIALAAAGCSVKNSAVLNEPPVIRTPAEIVGSSSATAIQDYGKLDPKVVTAFYWPSEWNEAQAERGVKIVNDASTQFELLQQKHAEQTARIKKLWEEFAATDCLKEYANGTRRPENSEIRGETEAIDWAADTPKMCIENQIERFNIRASLENIPGEARAAQAMIESTINAKNFLVMDIGMIRISKDEAGRTVVGELSFNKFISDDYAPSIENQGVQGASYDPVSKTLSFVIPEVARSGSRLAPTGKLHVFSLMRLPTGDAKTFRLRGDVYLVNGAEVLQGTKTIMEVMSVPENILKRGAAQIGGRFTAQ